VLYTKLRRSQVKGGKERRREGRSRKGERMPFGTY